LESPEQLPGFGYTSATAVDAAARAAGLGIVAGLFGPDLDAAIVPNAGDSNGARCQSDVLKYTSDLFYTMWKEALTAKNNVLKGPGRLTGTGPIGSTAELQGELVASIQADAKGKIAKAATKLHDKAALRCTGTLTSLAQMFPGTCAGSATTAALGVCAEGVARGQFFQSLGAADALAIDCDLADAPGGPAARGAAVLPRRGSGPAAWSRQRTRPLGAAAYIQEQLPPQTTDDGALAPARGVSPSRTMPFLGPGANYVNTPPPPQ